MRHSNVRAHTHTHTSAHTHILTHTHTYTHTHTLTHTHTHTNTKMADTISSVIAYSLSPYASFSLAFLLVHDIDLLF